MLMGTGGGLVDTQTMTGEYFYGDDPKSGITGPYYGRYQGLMGSVSDGSFNPNAGSLIVFLYWDGGTLEPNTFIFGIGAPANNTGWNKLVVTSTYTGVVRTFYRGAATYSYDAANGLNYWKWSTTDNPIIYTDPGQNTYICQYYR